MAMTPIASPVAALTTLVTLVVLTPAAAAPLIPAVKSAQCPFGYMQSGGFACPCLVLPPPPSRRSGNARADTHAAATPASISACVDAGCDGCKQRTKRGRVRLGRADAAIE